jgi:hypothetical protein
MVESHPCVERVYYPGLASHRQHEVATKLGMMSILIKPKELRDGQEEALQVSSTPFCPSPSSDLMEMGFRLSSCETVEAGH